MKNIFVVCGAGIASSQAVASKLITMCSNEALPANIQVVDIHTLENTIDNCDILVTLVPPGAIKYGKPVINGIPFLTGYQVEEEFEKLKRVLH